MTSKIGIIYNCEGSGHAMRMLAIAQRLEEKNIQFKMTGGGPGEKFLEMRGLSSYKPRVTDMRTRIEQNILKAGLYTFTDPIKRIKDLRKWIRKEEHDAVITDDPSGLIAAYLEGKKFYTVSHVTHQVPEDRFESWATWIINRLVIPRNEEFFYPVIWEGLSPEEATCVGPLAPKGEEMDLEFDILVVPTEAAEMEERFIKELKQDYEVKVVGSDEWELQPSLQPFISEADVVICAGYSTMMEASVAGTSVVMMPQTSEQKGVAKLLKDHDGFKMYSGDIMEDVEEVERPEPRENGADQIAEMVSQDLR
ncbi:hypothetical protein AQV86_02150 [Nanohaloarchaea archaeon SG9]|nr:hypothetical protein AQV86_02150 [Nanohaloarchaea archaeon SG9]